MSYLDLDHAVELDRNLYAINNEVAELYRTVMTSGVPCGYAWTNIKPSANGFSFDGTWAKEGQAETGDVKARVKAFATVHPQIILDVLIDSFFNHSHRDKQLNEWRDKHEDGVALDHSARTLEGMLYENDQSFEELRIRRQEALAKITSDPLAGARQVKLHTTQAQKARDALSLFSSGCRSILADLCARFGKTIWSGAVARGCEADVVVITSYVKTAFTSFRTDLGNKIQFAEVFTHINAEDPDYQSLIEKALKAGRRVVVYISLCNGSNRQDRIDYCGSVKCKQRLWIVDEADFGAHQPKQVEALSAGVKDEDYLILMTGTNPDKAVKGWSDRRQFSPLSCTYTELLVQKEETKQLLGV